MYKHTKTRDVCLLTLNKEFETHKFWKTNEYIQEIKFSVKRK